MVANGASVGSETIPDLGLLFGDCVGIRKY